MPDSFGARLRERREQQNVALSTIADQTKIKLSLLESLERDDVSHWPSGIFRRAFIRAYAQAIGLDPDTVLREFIELYPDPIEMVATVPRGEVDGARTEGAPTRLRFLVASAIGSVSRLRTKTTLSTDSVFDVRGTTEALVPHARASVALEEESAAPPAPQRMDQPSERPELEEFGAPSPLVNQTEPAEASKASIEGSASAGEPAASDPNLLAVANLCTELSRVATTDDVGPLLQEASRILDAVGMIVWVWDSIANELRPALAHGYSDKVLAQLPRVERDGNNATAAAFRAAQTCVVPGSDHTSGALVVPMMTPTGCGGVLAIELNHRREERDSIRALATIITAQLASLIGATHPGEAADRRFA